MGSTNSITLTEELQDMIAAEMLVTVDDAYLFFNIGPIQNDDEEARQPGTNIVKFNRPTLPTGATNTESARRLTDGTSINLTGIAIAETQVSLTTREYGGPHDGTSVTPFIVTEFLKTRAKHNVIEVVGSFLRRDYNRWQDCVVRDLLLAASIVVTPDGSTSATVAADTKASVAWLRDWNKQMKDNKIPTYPNGRWRLMLSTTDESSLKNDPDYKRAMVELAGSNPLFAGHVASFEGFDIMVTTNISTTAVGAGSAVTGNQSAAWGPYGLGWSRPLPPSVRAADDTDFGRKESLIWVSHEAIGTLYSDLISRGITTRAA